MKQTINVLSAFRYIKRDQTGKGCIINYQDTEPNEPNVDQIGNKVESLWIEHDMFNDVRIGPCVIDFEMSLDKKLKINSIKKA